MTISQAAQSVIGERAGTLCILSHRGFAGASFLRIATMLQYARAHGDGVQSGRAFFARALRVLNIALKEMDQIICMDRW